MQKCKNTNVKLQYSWIRGIKIFLCEFVLQAAEIPTWVQCQSVELNIVLAMNAVLHLFIVIISFFKKMKIFRILKMYVLVLFLGTKNLATVSNILQNCSYIYLICKCLCCEIEMNSCWYLSSYTKENTLLYVPLL